MRRLIMEAMVAAALLLTPACIADVDEEGTVPATEQVGAETLGEIGYDPDDDFKVLVPELEPETIEMPALVEEPRTPPGLDQPEFDPGTPRLPAEGWEDAGEPEGAVIADLCKRYEGLCEWDEWERIPPR
jgi:hypothetical protein